MLIIPAILETTFSGFVEKLKKFENIFPLIQIDVMDGDFVPEKSFEEIDKINELKNLPDFELHPMVQHPLEEIKKWDQVKNIKKIFFHVESLDDPYTVISLINGRCAQAGLAINPETDLERIIPLLDRVSEVLFLSVHPGQQGAEFLPEIGKKILQFSQIENRPLIGIDGGVNEKTIDQIKNWPIDACRVGSALTKSNDPKEVLKKLQ